MSAEKTLAYGHRAEGAAVMIAIHRELWTDDEGNVYDGACVEATEPIGFSVDLFSLADEKRLDWSGAVYREGASS
jgi:hypothetical protein